MPKRKSQATSTPELATKRLKPLESQERFEQFQPTEEFSEKYRLDLEGADVYYKEEFIPSETADKWYEELNQLDTWYRPTLKVYGRDVIQSRLGTLNSEQAHSILNLQTAKNRLGAHK